MLAITATICLGSVSMGQTGYIPEAKLDAPIFEFDFATFRSLSVEDKVTLEIYYKIYNDGLQYYKQDDRFVANYEFNVVVLGTDKNQVTGFSRERRYKVDAYDDTKNHGIYFINQINLEVPKGKFKIVCKLIDKLSEKVSTIEKDLKVDHLYQDELDMSDIELIYAVEDTTEERSGFDKGEKRIVPTVSKTISGESPKIAFYVELYNQGSKPVNAVLQYKVKRRNKTVYEDEFPLEMRASITRLIKEIPADEFVPGEYNVKFELKKNGKKKIAERELPLVISWSLTALIRNDYETAVEQLKYIASDEERDSLKSESEDQREKAFEDFWKDHDKYPETPENETRALYYARVMHANEYFSVVNQDGWRTDRGRIYIIFGEPDHVERYPFELTSVPYQIWYYYRFSRTFVFEDTHHTGDYYLRFPYDGRRGGLHETFEDFD